MSDTQFDTDIGGQTIDFEDFDTNLFGGEGLSIDLDSVINAAVPIQPKTSFDKPPVVSNFNASSGAAVTASMKPTLTSNLNTYKPEKINTEKFDGGVKQKGATANQQVADAKSALALMKEQGKEMTQDATADSGPSNDVSLTRKLAGNAVFDAGAIGGSLLVDPTGTAASIVAGGSILKDGFTIGGHAIASLAGQGTAATNGKGTDLADSARKYSASKGDDSGYVSSGSSPVDDAPVTTQTFAKLSQGPGFGKAPGLTEGQSTYPSDTLPYMTAKIDETPEFKEALNTLKAGTDLTADAALIGEKGYAATADNLAAAQSIAPTTIESHPYMMKNPNEIDLEAGPNRIMAG